MICDTVMKDERVWNKQCPGCDAPYMIPAFLEISKRPIEGPEFKVHYESDGKDHSLEDVIEWMCNYCGTEVPGPRLASES